MTTNNPHERRVGRDILSSRAGFSSIRLVAGLWDAGCMFRQPAFLVREGRMKLDFSWRALLEAIGHVLDGVLAILGKPKLAPVTQDTTVAGTEYHHAPAEGTA